MKLYKLFTHQKSFSNEDLILNPKEHPNVNINDVVEIYHIEDDCCRLLLQVTCLNEDLKGRESISVEANIAAAFNLRTYTDVFMRVVDPKDVALDSVEITFKDQYMGRSEMWRLKTALTNTCVYMNKKIKFCAGSIRCQIYEMWSQGDRVSCGVINEETKVVFRSSTSMVYLFLQMSSEMWDFDIHGDLYFEKAVNGFLTDLFMKWKKLGSNHEVTIVLFSRTFYAAKVLEEFPPHMRECLQKDYKGRFYEDFYRVAIQNERNDDWGSILVQLRRLFTSYQSMVLHYHEKPGMDMTIPIATNSTAAQGNFLEVLNISLNVFEKHYLDRSFDRTGQLSVVVTPGVGVFEVDRELTNITKQRIIDNGVGSDLVCVGEQPLHAVPLLKFHNKDSSLTSVDDYSMPHWINLSFYSTNKKVAYSTFIPRIKLPPLLSQTNEKGQQEFIKLKFLTDNQNEYIHNSLFDYDAYDAQIFQLPPAHGTCSLQRIPRTKKTSVPSLEGFGTMYTKEWDNLSSPKSIRRKMSDPDIHHTSSMSIMNSSPINKSPNTGGSLSAMEKTNRRFISSTGPVMRTGRALINPFDPSHVTIKLTSNRRRWTHIFPKGPTGVLIQQHHYQAVPTTVSTNSAHANYSKEFYSSCSEYAHTSTCTLSMDKIQNSVEKMNSNALNLGSSEENKLFGDVYKKRPSLLHSAVGPLSTVAQSNSLTLLWGATGEQEWTPALTTGVDWKSLTIPACLPITTDYFPDKRSLHNDYVVSDYTLLPDDVNAEYAQNRAVYKKPLSTFEVFKELVSQRLAQGFQLIVLPDKTTTNPLQAPCCGGHLQTQYSVHRIFRPQEQSQEYYLSIGRIFHKISLSGSAITVTRYRPRHPYPPINVDYRYRFQAPQHDTYEVSGVNFTTEKLENFNWNYMDQYICTRGDTDFRLHENMKYWRFRILLLPKDDLATKKILDGASMNCDIYTATENVAMCNKQIIEDFLRFVEIHLNKIKRLQVKKIRGSPTAQQSHLTLRRHSTSIITRPPPNQGLGNSPFRERLGSNRLPEKPRPRSGSKVIDRSQIRNNNVPDSNASGLANNNELFNSDDTDDSFTNETSKISASATLSEIFEHFKNPLHGVGFLGQTQSLPSFTFVSSDAINWLKNRIDGPCSPVQILEAMREAKFICHASGDFKRKIIPGFYLYYIAHQDKDNREYTPPLGDIKSFENEWLEVEIKNPDIAQTEVHDVGIPKFLCDNIDLSVTDGPLYKQTHLEVDVGQKSDRIEWGHARYQTIMQPGSSFELVVQWITASGAIVYDLIYNWSRKAQQCNFQLVCIPADPLAEPFIEKSDPLRGPIFITLDIECLKQHRTFLFEEFKKETWAERLLLFQEAIVARFGFMPCQTENKIGSNQPSFDFQYVHCSGNMFILVPSQNTGLKSRQRLASNTAKKTNFPSRYSLSGESQKLHEAYVTRHVSAKNKEDYDITRKTGFLWSWNHMIANKKWKLMTIKNTDELFQLRMLKDFKNFCRNQDNRLVNFWEECWEKKERASLPDK